MKTGITTVLIAVKLAIFSSTYTYAAEDINQQMFDIDPTLREINALEEQDSTLDEINELERSSSVTGTPKQEHLTLQDINEMMSLQRCIANGNSSSQEQSGGSFSVCDSGGTVMDNRTGLVWSRCALGKTWNMASRKCEGEALKLNWKEALNEVKKMNEMSYLSFNDWRLPNIKELASIVKLDCAMPAIDKRVFPGTDQEDFWTSTVFEQYPGRAWYVNFKYGQDYAADKRYFKQVRAVRLGHGVASYNVRTDGTSSNAQACATLPEIHFNSIENVPLSSLVESEQVVVNFSGGLPTKTVSIENGEYQINNGQWQSGSGSISSGDKIKIRHTSSANYLDETTSILHVGAVSAVFRSKTMAAEVQPYEDVLIDAEVVFEYDSANLSDEAKENIRNFVEQYRSRFNQIKQIVVIGHTDNIASQQYNQKLSERRAQAVARFIESISGIPDSDIEAIGKGKLEPIASNDTEEGRAKNRRVVIRFVFEE